MHPLLREPVREATPLRLPPNLSFILKCMVCYLSWRADDLPVECPRCSNPSIHATIG